jgi:hypothetical protein
VDRNLTVRRAREGRRGTARRVPFQRWALLAALLATAGAAHAAEPTDPFPLRNQLPFHLLFLGQTPRSAYLLPPRSTRLDIRVAYMNTLVGTDDLMALFRRDDFATLDGEVTLATLATVAADTPGRTAFFLDGETAHAALDMAFGAAPRLEIGIQVPFLLHNGGLFDPLIENYHERLSLPDGGRPYLARKRFVAGYVGDGAEVFIDGPPGGVRLGDLVVDVRTALSRGAGRAPAVTASLSLKLPTGDPDRLDGSGNVDYGVGLQVSKRVGRSTFHVDYAYTVPGRWDLAPGLPLRNGRALATTYGLRFGRRTAFVAQLARTRGPFPFRSGSDLGGPSMEIALGLRHRVRDDWDLSWAFLENLMPQHNTPDVGLFLCLSYRPATAQGSPDLNASH